MSEIGFDWGSIAKHGFGAIHTAGKAAAGAFGFGGAAKALEDLEAGAGLLPDWAGGKKSPASPASTVVPAGPSPDEIRRAVDADAQATFALAAAALAEIGGNRDKADRARQVAEAAIAAAGVYPPHPDRLRAASARAQEASGEADRAARAARAYPKDAKKRAAAKTADLRAHAARLYAAELVKFSSTGTPIAGLPSTGSLDMSDENLSVLGDTIVGEVMGDEVEVHPAALAVEDHIYGLDVLIGAQPLKLRAAKLGRGLSRAQHREIAKRGASIVQRAAASGRAAVAKGQAHKPGKTVVVGFWHEIVGLVIGAAPKGILTAKQKKAVEKHNKAVERSNRAAVAAVAAGKSAEDAAKRLSGVMKGQKKAITASAKARSKVAMRGEAIGGEGDGRDADELAGIFAAHSDYTVDESDQVGALGEVDVIGGDPGAIFVLGIEEEYAPPTDVPSTGIGPGPEQQVWRNVAPDGVVYKGDRGFPDLGFGSWSVFYGTKTGALGRSEAERNILSQYGMNMTMEAARAAAGDLGDGYVWYFTGPDKDRGWKRKRGKKLLTLSGTGRLKDVWPATAQVSIDEGFGALIGNPNNPDTKGLKYAMEDQKWFWFRDDAPEWATHEEDAQAALVARETEIAAQEAAAAEQAQAEKDAAAQAEAQAKQEADAALAEETHQTEIRRESERFDVSEAQRQAQLDAERQRFEMEMQRMQAQQAAATPSYGGPPGNYAPEPADQGVDWGAGQPDASEVFAPEELSEAQERTDDAEALDRGFGE